MTYNCFVKFFTKVIANQMVIIKRLLLPRENAFKYWNLIVYLHYFFKVFIKLNKKRLKDVHFWGGNMLNTHLKGQCPYRP